MSVVTAEQCHQQLSAQVKDEALAGFQLHTLGKRREMEVKREKELCNGFIFILREKPTS